MGPWPCHSAPFRWRISFSSSDLSVLELFFFPVSSFSIIGTVVYFSLALGCFGHLRNFWLPVHHFLKQPPSQGSIFSHLSFCC